MNQIELDLRRTAVNQATSIIAAQFLALLEDNVAMSDKVIHLQSDVAALSPDSPVLQELKDLKEAVGEMAALVHTIRRERDSEATNPPEPPTA